MKWLRRNIEPVALYGCLLLGLFVAHVVMNGGVHLLPVSRYIEAQEMEVLERSGEFELLAQGTETFKDGQWNQDNHLFALCRDVGQSVSFQFAVGRGGGGPYRIQAFLTKSYDYGIVRIEVNGKMAKNRVDLYSGTGVAPTGAVDLGTHFLTDKNTMGITVIGRNPANLDPYYQWGFDGIRLSEPAE